MLKTRVITAVIGFIIALGAITLGGSVYDVLITLLALLGWREFVLLGKAKHVRMSILWGYISILLLSIGMISLLMIRHDSIYMSLSMPFELYNWGTITLWLVLFTTWASDTFAYFAGRAFGKHKIVPSISPNKTLEGFIGGFIGCIITGAVFSYIAGIPWWMGIHVGMISGILAPLGDLFESKIKRLCNVKDSGTLLPGHGGVLDRFDSLLFTAPITLIYILLFSF